MITRGPALISTLYPYYRKYFPRSHTVNLSGSAYAFKSESPIIEVHGTINHSNVNLFMHDLSARVSYPLVIVNLSLKSNVDMSFAAALINYLRQRPLVDIGIYGKTEIFQVAKLTGMRPRLRIGESLEEVLAAK
ncbi:hypothetical protein KW787_03085 [Candidatus Pacearchaeota archaeon]|nr:hypothetical protein [Candidatus Pacearchaeota archaeon]